MIDSNTKTIYQENFWEHTHFTETRQELILAEAWVVATEVPSKGVPFYLGQGKAFQFIIRERQQNALQQTYQELQ